MRSGPSAAISSDRLSSGNIKTDYIDPVRTSANWKPPQIANLHRQGGPKLLHRRAGCEKATLNTTTEFLKPRSGVHDITVKDNCTLDVADLSDNHRTEMQTSANARHDAELAFELP
jgi:hypothetical protein